MCYHLTSPASSGLFNGLIMHSGSCHMQNHGLERGIALGRAYAAHVGCEGSGPSARECLLGKPAMDLVCTHCPFHTTHITCITVTSAPASGTLPWHPALIIRFCSIRLLSQSRARALPL